MYTEWYWQMDLHNLFHFLKLRLDLHAQKEIRLYSEVLLEIARKVAPLSCFSFENHVLKGVRFSGEEMDELRKRLNGQEGDMPQEEKKLSGKALERLEEKIKSGRQL